MLRPNAKTTHLNDRHFLLKGTKCTFKQSKFLLIDGTHQIEFEGSVGSRLAAS